MRLVLIALFLLAAFSAAWAEPVVSWFDLYPIRFYPADDNDEIPVSGANSITYAASSNWFVRTQEDTLTFDFLDAQVQQLRSLGLGGSIICEVNPLYHSSAPWLSEKCSAAGETIANIAGVPSPQPSIASPVFNRELEILVREWMKHLDEIDPEKRVSYVHPGAEWWFNTYERYGKTDTDAFKTWLRNKYKSISALNKAWGSDFPSFEAVEVPRVQISGNGIAGSKGQSIVTDAAYGDCQASYVSGPLLGGEGNAPQLIPVRGGDAYTLSFDVKTEGLGGGAYAELNFANGDNTGFTGFRGSPYEKRSDTDWHTISCSITAPADSAYVTIQLQLAGHGRVRYRNLSFRSPEGEELAKPLSEWGTVIWSGKEPRHEYANGECMIENLPKDRAYSNGNAAVGDWTRFWYEHAAYWINHTHSLYKQNSYGRRTVSYLTNSFAWGVEWDSIAAGAISLDRVLMNSGSVDEIGMQVCSADGDDYRITCALDTARKYRKPMWAVDLVDFTSGVHIGEWHINKMAQNAVASGARGLVYCGWDLWHLTDDYSYKNHVPIDGLRRINEMAAEGIRTLEDKKAPKEAAIIHTALPATSDDAEGYKNSPFSFMGWYKILKSCLVNVDVVSLAEIEKNPDLLDDYKLILVPHCPYISSRAGEALQKRSDRLFFGGEFARCSDTGAPYSGGSVAPARDYGSEYCGELIRDTHAGNTPPLFLWGEETPERSGVLCEASLLLLRELKARGIRLPFETDNRYLSATRWQGGGETVYYFVNQRKTGSFSLTITGSGKGVTVVRDGVVSEVRTADGGVDIGSFDTSCIVRIKHEF
ncbi:MAG: beta-galactosidase [Abditibacteriota bacterium]|nr:beta-galactosidase [Abditibacteriota bacterium]